MYLSLYGVLTVITAVGIIGQVKQIGSFDLAEIQLGKKLIASSAILFIVVMGFMIVFTILLAIIGPAPMRSQFTLEGIPCKPGVRPRLFASTFFLLFLQACSLVEPIFHLWSIIDPTNFLKKMLRLPFRFSYLKHAQRLLLFSSIFKKSSDLL